MKSFVRGDQRDAGDALVIAAVIGTMMFAAEELGEVAYVPLCAFLAIEFTKDRLQRRQRSKALLGAGRSRDSR